MRSDYSDGKFARMLQGDQPDPFFEKLDRAVNTFAIFYFIFAVAYLGWHLVRWGAK